MRSPLLLVFPLLVIAQPQTHTVRVNADGSFSPRVLAIKSGDTVRWENLGRTDSIIPVTNATSYPALCSARRPVEPADQVPALLLLERGRPEPEVGGDSGQDVGPQVDAHGGPR